MAGVIVATGFVIWVAVGVGLGVFAVDRWFERGWRNGWVFALATILWFTVPAGLMIEGPDPHGSLRCLSGHQEWTRETRPAMVGKVVIASTVTRKVWVCDTWEAE